VLQVWEELPALAAINMVSGLTLTGMAVLAAYAGFGAIGLAFAYLVGPLLSCALALGYMHRRHIPITVSISIRRTFELVKEARMLGVKVFTFTMGDQAENLLVPMAAGMAVFGQFAAATILIRRLEVIPDALCSAFYPHMARAWSEGHRGRLRLLALLPVVLCVPPSLVVFALADLIGSFLFPDSPQTTAYVVRATVSYLPLVALALGTGFALNAVRRDTQDALILIAATAVSLVATPVLIWHFGLRGA
jgi:O-antigen/teichoic acid export membrane protein